VVSRRVISAPAPAGWYVGVDQSLTNFAAVAISGPKDMEPRTLLYKPKLTGVRRLHAIQEHLADWLKDIEFAMPIRHITMEGYAFSRQMGHALGECGAAVKLGLLEWFGIENQLSYPSVPTAAQLKMFVGLPGNAQKNLVLKAVFKKYGVDFNDDNLADAYVLAQIACSLQLGARLEYEKKVLAKVKVHAEWDSPKLLNPRQPRIKSSA
jgi:hypothetical protein